MKVFTSLTLLIISIFSFAVYIFMALWLFLQHQLLSTLVYSFEEKFPLVDKYKTNVISLYNELDKQILKKLFHHETLNNKYIFYISLDVITI